MKTRYILYLLLALSVLSCKTRQSASTPPVVTTVVPPTLPQKTPQPIKFVLLQLNDVYEISPMDHGKVAGMARVATVRKQLQAAGYTVITVLSGDYLSPSLMGTLKCSIDGKSQRVNGRQMVEVMNAIGVDYVTFGNHEFDLKLPDLQARNAESKFQIISANVKLKQDAGGYAPFQQNGQAVPDYAVRRIWNNAGDTMRLGMLGVTLPFNMQPYLEYLDIYNTAADAYNRAQKESDVVVGITHLSVKQDDTLSRRLPGMPLLLGGHEHTNMLVPVGSAHIAKADANAKSVYLHWCTFDPATKKVAIFSQLMPITEVIESDPTVTAIAQKWETFANQCMADQGYMPDDTIGYAMAPLDGRDATIRTGQTNMGFLICDAMRSADPKADVAIMNSGSVRLDDQIEGLVQQRHILATLPFGGDVQHGSILGRDLRLLLDKGLSAELNMNGAHLQYSSNLSRSGSAYSINGKPLVDTQKYLVTMPGFLTGKAPGTGETVYNTMGITTMADWQPIDFASMKIRQNDIRDIVIWAMKRDPRLLTILQMLRQK